ncbi:MAG: dipeptidase [Verrucomicrobiae bacterium]|nr:dipeptidase [Verrucomicrobiae bacterium]
MIGNALVDAVIEYLRTNQQRFLKELCQYLRLPSVSAQSAYKKEVARCAAWLAAHCTQLGLETRVFKTKGHPIVIAKTPADAVAPVRPGSRLPHFLVYGHYDVQPPEPLELWHHLPFEPYVKGRRIYARGAADNKGQHFAHLKAVEAYLKTKTPLPCHVTFLIEGEEEVGSPNLVPFLHAHRSELAADAIIISDTGMPGLRYPALTYALRGIISFEITVRGPKSDLHSGIYGGAVDNPAMVLCSLLAKARGPDGRVAIPGFYDDVAPLTQFERRQLARLPLKERDFKRLLGVPQLFGEAGYSTEERRSARPTFEINGLTSGYQGEGSKTIIPAWARAKVTCRLVPNQHPGRIRQLVLEFFRRECPPTVQLEIKSGSGSAPYMISPESPRAKAALRALRAAFGREPLLMREGGSIPIVPQMSKVLGAEVILLGLALPDANAHAPNENFDVRCFAKGQLLSAYLWQELPRPAE